jgi:hypothetical protein
MVDAANAPFSIFAPFIALYYFSSCLSTLRSPLVHIGRHLQGSQLLGDTEDSNRWIFSIADGVQLENQSKRVSEN